MTKGKNQKKIFKYKLKSSSDQITKIVQKFDELLEKINCCSSRVKSELSTALSEAVANAIIHGNKNQVDKFVDIHIEIDKEKIKISVKDEGKGFNIDKIPNPLDPKNLKKTNGRGIYLMSFLVDDIEFRKNKSHMVVNLTKFLHRN